MSFSSRQVMVPVGAAMGKSGRIASVFADGIRPDNDAKLIPEIALLNDCRLYPAGSIALAALRQMAIKPPRLAVTQWLGKMPRGYLSVSNAPELYGLTPENSASAQLGLALALAMYRAQSTARLVIATGELLTKGSLSMPGGGNDVAVGPVGLIDAKIETVYNLLRDYKGGPLAPSIPFFFPRYTMDGQETLIAHAAAFERAVGAYRERGVTLDLHPVTSLGQALATLGIKELPLTGLDRVAAVGLLFVLLAILASVAVNVWQDQPIRLAFAPLDLAEGEQAATPFPAKQLKGGLLEQQELCVNANGMPTYPAGGWLVLRVRIEDWPGWLDWLGPYQFAAVNVAERSEVKVFPPESWGGKAGDREVSFRLPVTDVAEASKLIILAKRGNGFDTGVLRARVAAIANALPPGERINAVVNMLAKTAPGYIDYSFQTTKADAICEQ